MGHTAYLDISRTVGRCKPRDVTNHFCLPWVKICCTHRRFHWDQHLAARYRTNHAELKQCSLLACLCWRIFHGCVYRDVDWGEIIYWNGHGAGYLQTWCLRAHQIASGLAVWGYNPWCGRDQWSGKDHLCCDPPGGPTWYPRSDPYDPPTCILFSGGCPISWRSHVSLP